MNTYMSENVGRRIVDALKKQSEVEYTNSVSVPVEDVTNNEQLIAPIEPEQNIQILPQQTMFNQMPEQTITPQTLTNNMYSTMNNNFSELNGLEVPTNVAVLRQLISQLPSGVSRQAGALVIKQTMEALGISMKSVLSEAQQLQENLNSSARDCQNSILECKKQINILEAQVQKYQKQSASLNDIVSLFLQLN